MPRKAEIAELDDAVAGNQNVLGFHISVGDSVAVQIVERPHQLLCNLADLP